MPKKNPDTADAAAADAPETMATVRMVRDEEQYPPQKHGPSSAEVHVDEVDNWAAHGWTRAD